MERQLSTKPQNKESEQATDELVRKAVSNLIKESHVEDISRNESK